MGKCLRKRKDQYGQSRTSQGSGKTEIGGVGSGTIMQGLWGQVINVRILP